MSFENPKEGFVLPVENLEDLKREAQEYFDLLMEKYNDGNVSGSAQHILGNVAGSIQACWSMMTKAVSAEETRKWHQQLLGSIQDAKRYLGLLKDFPEFAEKELKSGSGGFFPRLFKGQTDHRKIIDNYESALRGGA